MDDSGSDLGGGGYLTSPGFGKILSDAMDDFAEALTYRWRERVTQSIVDGTDDFPTWFRRYASEFDTPLWDYWTTPAGFHLGYYGAQCAYVQWVNGGQEGDLGGVTCDGATGSPPDAPMVDENDQPVPANIRCGMGDILTTVESWARGERDAFYQDLLVFDGNDVTSIGIAHSTYLNVGAELGLTPAEGSANTGLSFDTATERDLAENVTKIGNKDGDGQTWWAGWTGLAAENAQAGFFASVKPTLDNQAGIMGCLANLYAARAAIVVKARTNALYWAQWATKSLKDTQTTTTNLVPGWKVVQGIGAALSVPPPTAVVGAAIALVGFLGENLLGESKSEGYAFDLQEAMDRFGTETDNLAKDIDQLETEYASLVTQLRTTIWSVHSFNLELYDLTENNPGGDHAETGASYTVNVDDVLRIAEFCYDAGEQYSGLRSTYRGVDVADAYLTGKDGEATAGDRDLLAIRDEVDSFLETTYGRYLLAGDQTKASAEEYVKIETDQQDAFDSVMNTWDEQGIGDHSGVDPGALADDTDRGAPPPGGPAAPGPTDTDYVTEENP